MTHPPPELDLATLQEEIRRAGRATRGLRAAGIGALLFVASGTLAALLGMEVCSTAMADGDPAMLALRGWLLLHGDSLTLLALASAPLAFTPPLVFRRLRRSQLRRKLAPLSDAERAAVLGPLRREDRDTRSLVAPLLKERTTARGHLVPAPAPTGRGNEMAPEMSNDGPLSA